jgi:hypothetical protein
MRRAAVACVSFLLAGGAAAQAAAPKSFATPDAAVRALIETVKAGKLDELVALFGPQGQALVDTSDPATGRQNREVFLAAVAEGFRIADKGPDRKVLVLGNEDWPFPVPLVKSGAGWSFDAVAGREEILNRRIGRNELDVIRILGEYVAAQRAYAAQGHDGKPAGQYARVFGSDPGKQNGLYWPAGPSEPKSPLGVTIATASDQGYRRAPGEGPSPLHGYYFRILEGQGSAMPGLVAWPVYYGASGVMTFVVNHDGAAYEQDLGAETAARVKAVSRDTTDSTWRKVEKN